MSCKTLVPSAQLPPVRPEADSNKTSKQMKMFSNIPSVSTNNVITTEFLKLTEHRLPHPHVLDYASLLISVGNTFLFITLYVLDKKLGHVVSCSVTEKQRINANEAMLRIFQLLLANSIVYISARDHFACQNHHQPSRFHSDLLNTVVRATRYLIKA